MNKKINIFVVYVVVVFSAYISLATILMVDYNDLLKVLLGVAVVGFGFILPICLWYKNGQKVVSDDEVERQPNDVKEKLIELLDGLKKSNPSNAFITKNAKSLVL